MSRARHQIRASIFFATFLSACSTSNLVPEFAGLPDLPNLLRPSGSPEEVAWADLLRHSSSRQVERDRVIVEAWGKPGTGYEAVELRLLARAAAEVERIGYTHFVLAHVTDRNRPVAGGLSSFSLFGADEYTIGSYEDLVRSRYERDYGAAPRTWLSTGLSSVVLALNSEDLDDYEQVFEASSVYQLLNSERMPR